MKLPNAAAAALMLISICSCSPKVVGVVYESREPLPQDEPVNVIALSQQVSSGARVIGHVEVFDTGFTSTGNCTYERVVARASEFARTIGGNMIKINAHEKPSFWRSTCHQIRAEVIFDPAPVINTALNPLDSELFLEGCAAVHFYRFADAPGIGFDIKTGNEKVTTLWSDSKESLKVRAVGPTVFHVMTESREEIEIDLKPGRHYYIRCLVNTGLFIGRPVMQLVDNVTGKEEFDSIP